MEAKAQQLVTEALEDQVEINVPEVVKILKAWPPSNHATDEALFPWGSKTHDIDTFGFENVAPFTAPIV